MFNFGSKPSELLTSTLCDEKSFYKAFQKDLASCHKEVIIECPFITASRMESFYMIFEKLLKKGVKIHIITRDPIDHDDEYMRHQATNEILYCCELGINIIMLRRFHHRKLAILDRKVLYEGSLNILSQSFSIENMRRTESHKLAQDMLKFINLGNFL